MVTYIYFVKCPNCEDEHFDFFDEAKEFALGCLSQKPIITQTEVCRNDFGECTDHSDLGTVWSWEEAMKDTEGGYTEAEPTKAIFTKDDLKQMADGKDPEFDDDDFYFNNGLVEDVATKISFKNNADREEFSKLCREIGIITGEDLKHFMADTEATDTDLLDKLRAYRDGLGADFTFTECAERKPIPEGMTIEELVEEMEENEDTVECTLCQDLFDKSECRKELNLGWLCRRCADDLAARGEGPVFKEDNYWDFLDEELKPKTWICEFDGREIGTVVASTEEEAYEAMEREYPEYHYGLYDGVGIVYPADDEDLTENLNEELSFSEMVADSINHLTNDLGKDPMSDDFADLVIKDIEDNYDVDFPNNPEDYRAWASEVASEVSRQLNNQLDEDVKEIHDLGNEYDGGYPTETPEVSDSHLKLCPECGKETFDNETGICVNCGFN